MSNRNDFVRSPIRYTRLRSSSYVGHSGRTGLTILVSSLFLCANLCATATPNKQKETLVIDQAAIAHAQQQIAAEVTTLRRNQIIRCCLTATAVGAGIYGTYRLSQPNTPTQTPTPDPEKTPGQSSNIKTENAGSDTPRVGYLQWIGSSIGNGFLSVTRFAASMALGATAGNMASQALVYLGTLLTKSYDWRWLTRERTQFYALLLNLKCCAAALDPQSNVFNALTNVQVTITDHPLVANQDGAMPVMSFDELIALRALTQKTLTPTQRTLSEKQLKAVWQLIVSAVTMQLGFIGYKDQITQEPAQFDQHQLAVRRAQLIAETNALTEHLDQLIAQTSATISGGLLEQIYRYCNTISFVCGVLENNGIVGEA